MILYNGPEYGFHAVVAQVCNDEGGTPELTLHLDRPALIWDIRTRSSSLSCVVFNGRYVKSARRDMSADSHTDKNTTTVKHKQELPHTAITRETVGHRLTCETWRQTGEEAKQEQSALTRCCCPPSSEPESPPSHTGPRWQIKDTGQARDNRRPPSVTATPLRTCCLPYRWHWR